jgi:23S rRNA A1618 N6-methylase RlmF
MSSKNYEIPTEEKNSTISAPSKRKRNGETNNSNKQLSFPPITQITCNIAHSNFVELAESCPEFKAEWIKLKNRQRHNSSICTTGTSSFASNVDFDFNVALSRAILKHNFQLDLKCMPKGFLCPPIPNRFNYVLWIKELLKESSGEESGKYFQESRSLVRRGLDLGTGSSCIYPLLLSGKEFNEDKGWKFLGTDIDPFSIQCAQENIDANGLNETIQLALVPPTPNTGGCREIPESGSLDFAIPTPLNTACRIYSDQEVKFDFCMTNPPFYSSDSEATLARDGDNRERTDMTRNESVYPGGEMGFALDIVYDSFRYRDRITWYTLMLSKKSSLLSLEKELARLGFRKGSIRIAEFVQGKMVRWGVAWTFLLPRLRSPALKLNGGIGSFSVALHEEVPIGRAIMEVSNRIKTFASEMKMFNLKCDEKDARLVISETVDGGGRDESGVFLIDAFVGSEKSGNIALLQVRLVAYSSDFEGIEKARKIERQVSNFFNIFFKEL